MIIQFLLLAATYGIQMRGNLIDKSELVDEALPAASVPGNGTNTTHRLDANSRTAMWAIHEGYLQRALAGAANADAATPWGASTNLLSRQARSARLVRPGTQPLAETLGNPNANIDRFEQAFHPSGSSGLIWSSSHFADGTWPGVNARPELPTGNYGTAGIEALATNAWAELFSPIQRLASATGECNQVAKQFFDNCYAVSGGAITKPGVVYGHWEGAYLLPTNDNTLAQALELPGYRLNKRELDALNTVIAPFDILCQYGDNGGALKTMFEFTPTIEQVTHYWQYQANAASIFRNLRIHPESDTAELAGGTLSFGAPVTNYYSYATQTAGASLDWPRVWAEPIGGRLLATIPTAQCKLYVDRNDLLNKICDLYGEVPPWGWSCHYYLDQVLYTPQGAAYTMTLDGYDINGDHFADASLVLSIGGAEASFARCDAELSYNRQTVAIGNYNSSRSSRLAQEGFMPATPQITQYTQGATMVSATNGEELVSFMLEANQTVNARNSIKSSWQRLLNKMYNDFNNNSGYDPNDPSTIIGTEPSRGSIRLGTTGNVAHYAGVNSYLYKTNYLIRLTGPGVACSTVIRHDDSGDYQEIPISQAAYPYIPSDSTYEAFRSLDANGWVVWISGGKYTDEYISSYPADWPQGKRAEFERLLQQYRYGWEAQLSISFQATVVYEEIDDETPHRLEAEYRIYRSLVNYTYGKYIYFDDEVRDISSDFSAEKTVHSLDIVTNPAGAIITNSSNGFLIDGISLDDLTSDGKVEIGKLVVSPSVLEDTYAELPPSGPPISGECRMYYIQVLDFSNSSPGFSNYIEPGE